ncbi:hypothetical protein SKAU_G00305510 [Synaphobranchus kaupii]|uniref:Uncharacterized protein n=1 Tax=Synaphobranchus kaupii TaxID=118154 RepID=A0A9Q1EQP0_SYNKA|nr:hypothetical protein SKAU_G00305510 [Synaphobranchus kaupii]
MKRTWRELVEIGRSRPRGGLTGVANSPFLESGVMERALCRINRVSNPLRPGPQNRCRTLTSPPKNMSFFLISVCGIESAYMHMHVYIPACAIRAVSNRGVLPIPPPPPVLKQEEGCTPGDGIGGFVLQKATELQRRLHYKVTVTSRFPETNQTAESALRGTFICALHLIPAQ